MQEESFKIYNKDLIWFVTQPHLEKHSHFEQTFCAVYLD